ncbi:MAG TPA: dihydrolipoamide acetyltransferase family protein [Acidimicrobiales bacterium]|nr:dihydrolipoamide acetyltransferase family protein [Acidimicrobiales bacterium]
MADITMPQLGETVTEGTITKWMKKVGDTIAEDEVLFEVSTDKVDSEVPSPASGVVTEILVGEGETVDVGTKLAVISADGAAPAPAGAGAAAPAGQEDTDLQAEPEISVAETPPPEPPPQAAQPAPQAAQPAPQPEPPPAAAAQPAPPPVPAAPPAASGDGDPGRMLSPVVRRLVAEYNLDPAEIHGTGAGGRITRSDVLSLIDQRNGGTPTTARVTPPRAGGTPASAAPPEPAAAVAVPAPGEHDTVIPFTNIRRRTAEHMVRSKHTSAHTMVAVEVDYSGVEKVRQAQKAAFKEAEGFSLTYLPFVSRAAIDALEEFPNVNSSVGDDALIVHHDVNLGIAVDLDFEGLLVPVIHNADTKRLRALAREISGLAAKTRAKRLTMDDISGGTFTITNAGPFGTFITVPVIYQPQVAILSTDGVKKRPVVIELPDGSDGIAVHPVGNVVLSWDHRAFDGAYAAAFLAAIKDVIETRDWATEL